MRALQRFVVCPFLLTGLCVAGTECGAPREQPKQASKKAAEVRALLFRGQLAQPRSFQGTAATKKSPTVARKSAAPAAKAKGAGKAADKVKCGECDALNPGQCTRSRLFVAAA